MTVKLTKSLLQLFCLWPRQHIHTVTFPVNSFEHFLASYHLETNEATNVKNGFICGTGHAFLRQFDIFVSLFIQLFLQVFKHQKVKKKAKKRDGEKKANRRECFPRPLRYFWGMMLQPNGR